MLALGVCPVPSELGVEALLGEDDVIVVDSGQGLPSLRVGADSAGSGSEDQDASTTPLPAVRGTTDSALHLQPPAPAPAPAPPVPVPPML